MAAKKKLSKADGMTADTYSRKAASYVKRKKDAGTPMSKLEGYLVSKGVPMSQSKVMADYLADRIGDQTLFPGKKKAATPSKSVIKQKKK